MPLRKSGWQVPAWRRTMAPLPLRPIFQNTSPSNTVPSFGGCIMVARLVPSVISASPGLHWGLVGVFTFFPFVRGWIGLISEPKIGLHSICNTASKFIIPSRVSVVIFNPFNGLGLGNASGKHGQLVKGSPRNSGFGILIAYFPNFHHIIIFSILPGLIAVIIECDTDSFPCHVKSS